MNALWDPCGLPPMVDLLRLEVTANPGKAECFSFRDFSRSPSKQLPETASPVECSVSKDADAEEPCMT